MSPFTYILPPDLIAQRPAYPYDSARLLIANRNTTKISESTFSEIHSCFTKEDILVFNNTRVIPARIFGQLAGGAGVEILLLKKLSNNTWLCTGKPLKKFKLKTEIICSENLRAIVLERISSQEVALQFISNSGSDTDTAIEDCGVMPIPPYIRKGDADAQDREDYQSMFALHRGSIAAPTASLHFTPGVIDKIQSQGCRIMHATLHLGTASFLPLWNEDTNAEPNQPGKEMFIYDPALIQELKKVKERGGRVIAVGTSIVRALESMVRLDPAKTEPLSAHETDLFIRPGFEFLLVDSIITNFHQPKTTHLLLVQAFLGFDLLQESYEYALNNNFRFLSYGDGMLLV